MKDSRGFSKSIEAIQTTRQHLMRIGLMARIPNHFVGRDRIGGVHRDRQFDGAEIGTEVSASLANLVQDRLANLAGNLQ